MCSNSVHYRVWVEGNTNYLITHLSAFSLIGGTRGVMIPSPVAPMVRAPTTMTGHCDAKCLHSVCPGNQEQTLWLEVAYSSYRACTRVSK